MSLLDGVGHLSWWGFSPSTDLTTYCSHNKDGPLRILCVGGNDLRHVLRLMCSGREVEVYLMETNLELYCRHLLLLSALLQPAHLMGLQEKTELYLDLFGNSHVRSASYKFVKNNVPNFIRMVTDEDYLRDMLPMIDLSLLKFKERDFMEGIFKFWAADQNKDTFPMEKLWDSRVRAYLGERYDAGRNIFDMDFSMKLKERASLLDFNEYATWRQTGVGFEVRDGVYDTPNRTLCSGIIKMIGGEKRLARGYWGDIACSPYLPHGIHCHLKEMYEVRNRVNVRTASEVSEYNIMSLIHQINTGKPYDKPPKPDRFTLAAPKNEPATLQEVIEEEEEEEGEEVEVGVREIKIEDTRSNKRKPQAPLLELNKPQCNIKVKLLPLGTMEQLPQKQNLVNSFDLVYLSNSQVSYFTPELTAILKGDADVIVENIKFVPPISKELEGNYLPKIKEMAAKAKCEFLGPEDPIRNEFQLSFHRIE